MTTTAVRGSGRSYQVCRRCVMDTSDTHISFDETGLCEYCQHFDTTIAPNWQHGGDPARQLPELVRKIKKVGQRARYDCVIGVSGGLDSSYAAYVAVKKLGLRPLLYHVDAGWNTAHAVRNIASLVDGLGLDLVTDVINWSEMQDLQLAFFKAQVPDLDMPQDVAFFSSLYRYARRNDINFVVTGTNFLTECCREPEEWGAYPGIDRGLVRDIHRKFGHRKLRTFPIADVLEYRILYHYIYRIRRVDILNFIPYSKLQAEQELAENLGWQPFLHKHHESRFTRFFEDYWLREKFGYDKRKAHFSSLIMTGEMTREDAVKRLESPELDEQTMAGEFSFIAAKLGIAENDLRQLFSGPNGTVRSFRNKHMLISAGWNLLRRVGLERRLLR
ncbi:N-acetyl sugar amidotransferase [Novosphingobium jiangmenense]|uniref:N-acetyl sugar amidotransferase n=1 Tax=Novosphingobium jiangmenense TaxID=2791981 RepID=A0ABS0HJF2_9SPHN|nr:N-acetyl sugar amidotransferase [Novosphingobium jiangmenense]MBF9152150.1 N-acetyl sugar amidotransferase [Novosphingobium jiangmenense]